MLDSIRSLIQPILDSPNMATRRPVVDAHFQSNVAGLFVVGDLSGAPVVKLAMEHGAAVAEYIAGQTDGRSGDPELYDLIVAGSGAAGLNCALVAQDRGLRVLVLEKSKIANTIEDFPEGKWVYAEPDDRPPRGKLWLDGARKEELIGRWRQIIEENHLDVRTEEGVTAVRREKAGFQVTTPKAIYRARRVVLATGTRGTPRKLGVPGEDRENVYHRLYSPKHYQGERILVVGGGNSAVEAAITLAEQNQVTLSYRGTEFSRIFKDNQEKLKQVVDSCKVNLLFQSEIGTFGDGSCRIHQQGRTIDLPYDHAFVLIGADVPTEFLRSMGIRLENDWQGNPLAALGYVAAALLGLWLYGMSDLRLLGAAMAAVSASLLVRSAAAGSRFALLGVSFLAAYTIYGAKQAPGFEFWPFRGWGAKALAFFDRPWSFWYTVLYTAVMTVFGTQAMKRWGLDKKDRFQIWRYACLIGFQWVFFFLIPEFLFQWAVQYQWLGPALSADPNFANAAWRSYGIIYAWPLFFNTFFGNPHQIWVVWGVLLTFIVIPILALFHGKRYCSWICGCGGLAETLGDRWRHLAPKGKASIRWEFMNSVVLGCAAVVTVMMLASDLWTVLRKPAVSGLEYYHLIADVWLVGILPVSLYPFFGGKIWCRYWCPLAKLMQVYSAAFTRFRASRFAIHANEKCIGCGECTRNCQVGIDVMQFAQRQDELNNYNSSCIGCGICVTVCPMNVLSFSRSSPTRGERLVQIQAGTR